jgi:hypothetical protein
MYSLCKFLKRCLHNENINTFLTSNNKTVAVFLKGVAYVWADVEALCQNVLKKNLLKN